MSMPRPPRTLIMTIPPFAGGVPAKAAILARHLRSRGHLVRVGYYATLSDHPEAVAPSWRPWRKPLCLDTTCFGDVPATAVGCRWPELEFPYTRPSARWRRLIAEADCHVAVGGNPQIAGPLAGEGRPHLLWCAAGTREDRADRQASMAWPRRLVDKVLIQPRLEAMERRILATSDRIVAVSAAGRAELERLGAPASRLGLLPIPTDTDSFRPAADPAAAGVVGFCARLSDPRKDVATLLRAMRHLVRRGCRLRLCGPHDDSLPGQIAALGLDGMVDLLGPVPAARLPDFYRSLDVFAIPSRQEGFGIVGAEALACGVPVVSTRCGGPADYVRDGETGFLVPVGDAEMLAERLGAVIADRDLRHHLGEQGRALIERDFSLHRFATALSTEWRSVWGAEP